MSQVCFKSVSVSGRFFCFNKRRKVKSVVSIKSSYRFTFADIWGARAIINSCWPDTIKLKRLVRLPPLLFAHLLLLLFEIYLKQKSIVSQTSAATWPSEAIRWGLSIQSSLFLRVDQKVFAWRLSLARQFTLLPAVNNTLYVCNVSTTVQASSCVKTPLLFYSI